MNLESLEQSIIPSLDKALPYHSNGLKIADVAHQHWNILSEDLPFPMAVLKQSAMLNNLQWMQKFTEMTGIDIAPHGKATMSPQLYQYHLDHGAWGITVSTVQQLRVCLQFGIRKILLANQLVGTQAVSYVFQALKEYPDLEFYCLVDSQRALDLLLSEAKKAQIGRPLCVMLEMGKPHGRTGVRDTAEAVQLAQSIQKADPFIALYGIECYEGLFVSGDPEREKENVLDFLNRVKGVMKYCHEQHLFATELPWLSGGGSAFFDLVGYEFKKDNFSYPVKPLIRSASYLTLDSGFYRRLFDSMKHRHSVGELPSGGLQPALEVWSYVQSCPEPHLALLNMGKRHCSFDIDLPLPHAWFRPGLHQESQPLPTTGYKIFKMDDQHAYLSFEGESPLQVGDLVVSGISHPCTTFDRWAHIPLVDDQYNVITMIKTYF